MEQQAKPTTPAPANEQTATEALRQIAKDVKSIHNMILWTLIGGVVLFLLQMCLWVWTNF